MSINLLLEENANLRQDIARLKALLAENGKLQIPSGTSPVPPVCSYWSPERGQQNACNNMENTRKSVKVRDFTATSATTNKEESANKFHPVAVKEPFINRECRVMEEENEKLFTKLIPSGLRRKVILEEDERNLINEIQNIAKGEATAKNFASQRNKNLPTSHFQSKASNASPLRDSPDRFLECLADIRSSPIRPEVDLATEICSPIHQKIPPIGNWDDLDKSINDMKRKINEKLASGETRKLIYQHKAPIKARFEQPKPVQRAKSNARYNSNRVPSQKRNSTRSKESGSYITKLLIADHNARKKRETVRSGSVKRRCENCVQLLAKGFSTASCPCHKRKII